VLLKAYPNYEENSRNENDKLNIIE
jgi:hypothetical protein